MTGNTVTGAVRDSMAGGRGSLPVWACGAEGDDRFALVEVRCPPQSDTSVPPMASDALLLAVHAKVMASLTGNTSVVVGWSTSASTFVLCAMDVGEGRWSDLLDVAKRLSGEPHGAAAPDVAFDSVVESVPLPRESALPPDVILTVGLAEGHLRVRYRTNALERSQAERIAGYHARALALAVREPHRSHSAHTLLSAQEIDYQREELAGPVRALPDLRFHELFEDHVRLHPAAVAATHGGTELSYGELNRRANRIAWSLLDRGLKDEDVVAVAMERDLDWLASVLAVFKAGLAYLPIDPAYPTERVASMLTRSGCRTVLTGSGDCEALAEGVRAAEAGPLPVTGVVAAQRRDGNPARDVRPDQLAYVFFTSGSTGEPKGVMCEHAGMLNHLLAKIEDLELDSASVVAQTASQCFDISIWQFAAPLLLGGRTVIVSQRDIPRVERVLGVFAECGVTVAQLVPSFLEVLLSWVERQPVRGLVLRAMSVTGEEIKKSLVTRWFEAFPGIPLVNAYGLTETSDDTNHEVLHSPPEGDHVPLGRPVRNTSVAVVDDRLRPVPLGAPGEIVFSGVCVGRGYINDAERTRHAFLSDPDRPGGRLYRSGDFGRWLPHGRLAFLGRRDSQVKIRGFRVELGEVENHVLRVEGVRNAAAVVVDQGGAGNLLAVFYMASADRTPDEVTGLLARNVPGHMLPALCHRVEALPVTENDKVDRAALTALAVDLFSPGQTREPPRTGAEQRVATAWAAVLRVQPEQVGRGDHFFDRGGTSLAAIRLVMSLDGSLTHEDVARHPVLSDLALVMDDENSECPGDTGVRNREEARP